MFHHLDGALAALTTVAAQKKQGDQNGTVRRNHCPRKIKLSAHFPSAMAAARRKSEAERVWVRGQRKHGRPKSGVRQEMRARVSYPRPLTLTPTPF